MILPRREFLRTAAVGAGGLLLGFYMPSRPRLEGLEQAQAAEMPLVNSWLRIAPDNTVTVYVSKAEMGQSIYTALPQIMAEELELDWQKLKVEFAPFAPEYQKFGPFTGGSSSVKGGYMALRQTAAAAREMLVTAAAAQMKVAASECRADNGFVVHSGGKKLSFGEAATAAAKLPVPSSPSLKKESEFKFIGKSLRRLDTPAKVRGEAEFAVDVKRPNMLVATVRQSPVFGGEVSNWKQIKAMEKPGIRLVALPGAVGAVARNYWMARSFLDNLPVEFSGGIGGKSSDEIGKELIAASRLATAPEVHKAGDVSGLKVGQGTKKVEATYEVPYLAHATMEPMSCVAEVKGGSCEIWCGTQSPFFNAKTISGVLKIDEKNIKIHTTFLGGGFGRRAEQDFVIQAVLLSKEVGQPVKLIWSREEDMQHDFYRPAFAATMTGFIKEGQAVGWQAGNAGSSIIARWFPDSLAKSGGIDFTTIEGFKEINYAIPNQQIRCATTPTIAPVGFWRSVGSSQNAFFVESFIDEMAHAAGRDPLRFRLDLLADKPRHRAVLEQAARMASWDRKWPAGVGRGIALAESFGTIVAQVAEVQMRGKSLHVKKVFCAYDCGPVVNPGTIEVQMQSAINYGLSAALYGRISLKDGQVEQSNFHDYEVVRMAQAPQIVVARVASQAEMGGIGEPGTPPIAPAVANALFALTKKRIRKLPLLEGLT